MIKKISLLFILGLLIGTALYAQTPVVTDEFDTFLVTKQTKIGEVVGKIRLIEPNPHKITWSLVAPVPYADEREYLQPGQLDATKIVEIDENTAEIRLKKNPKVVPGTYYAEVRATNKEGYMDQVLIIVTKEETPKAEDALDIFTQRREEGGMIFLATEKVSKEKIDYAANVARALLMKDRRGNGRVAKYLKESKAAMTLFGTFEERNTAIGFYMHHEAVGLETQDLQDEEIIPDYVRLGAPEGLRRDASVEEITHRIHGGGIIQAYPGVQKKLDTATERAVARGFYRPQPGLPLEDYHYEYLAFALDIYYGVHTDRSFEGLSLTPENLKIIDPEIYDILHFLFPSKEEFFKEMGWE